MVRPNQLPEVAEVAADAAGERLDTLNAAVGHLLRTLEIAHGVHSPAGEVVSGPGEG